MKNALLSTVAVLAAWTTIAPSANAAPITWSPTFFNDIGLSAGDFTTFQSSLNSVLSFYSTNFASPNALTITVEFHAGNTGLGTAATYYNDIAYQDYRNALAATGTSLDDATALLFLPNTANNPVNSNTMLHTTLPLLRALGFAEGNLAVPWDASINLNVGLMALDRSGPINPALYDLMQVTYHELNEVLGWTSGLNGVPNTPVTVPSGPIDAADLFRYNGVGSRSFTSDVNEAAYLSIDNGLTSLANFNTQAPGDRQDFTGLPNPSVQDSGSSPGLRLDNALAERTFLDVVGYNVVPEPSAALLALGGAFGLLVLRRRRTQQSA